MPDAMASELAPGRFGLLGATGPDLVNVVASLEALLREQGVDATVASRELSMEPDGLTQHQAAAGAAPGAGTPFPATA